jgi:hypothetical protein
LNRMTLHRGKLISIVFDPRVAGARAMANAIVAAGGYTVLSPPQDRRLGEMLGYTRSGRNMATLEILVDGRGVDIKFGASDLGPRTVRHMERMCSCWQAVASEAWPGSTVTWKGEWDPVLTRVRPPTPPKRSPLSRSGRASGDDLSDHRSGLLRHSFPMVRAQEP